VVLVVTVNYKLNVT